MLQNFTIDNLCKRFFSWFNKDRKVIFFVTFIVGLLVHFELYSKELLAYDGYWHYGSFLAKGWEISLGRFLIPFTDLFRGSIVVSILTTVLSLIAISFASIYLNETLNIKKGYLKVLVSILLVVTPTISLTLMYPYTATGYSMALLFSILSIYFLSKPKNIKNILLTIICITATLGFYQAYLCVITVLFLMVYIFKIIENHKVSFKNFFIDLGIILLGMIIYYICLNIIVTILNLTISDYSNGSSILSLDTIKNIFTSIKNTYITFYNFYFTDNIFNNLGWYRQILNSVLFVMIFINFITIIIQNKIYKNIGKLIILCIMILIFPIFACSIELIAQSRNINLLMASALYLPIVVLLKQMEVLKFTKLNNIFCIFSFLICSILLWTYILSNNATYVATNLYNKQMYSVGNNIVEKLQENDEITDDTPIAIVGKLNFSIQNDELLNLTNFDVSDVNMWTWQIFLQDNLGLGRNICTFDDVSFLYQSQEFLDMPIYPDENCIKVIDGIAVVKLSY